MTKEEKVTPRWDAAVRSESLSWSIVRQIRDALFEGKLTPGEFVGSEITLAQQFGVSRMAARDALRSLSAMGIVEIRMGSRGGAWVATGNPERLVDALSVQLTLIGLLPEELLEAQSAISVAAAELAAKRSTEDDHKRLKEAAQATERAAESARGFTDAALKFHLCILEASKNRVLAAQFRALQSVLEPLLIANTTEQTMRSVKKSNAALLKAITAREGLVAGQLMRERVEGIKTFILGSSASEVRPAKSPSNEAVPPLEAAKL